MAETKPTKNSKSLSKDKPAASSKALHGNSQQMPTPTLTPSLGICCVSAEHGVGHSDYCLKSPNYNPKAKDPRKIKRSLPADSFAPSDPSFYK